MFWLFRLPSLRFLTLGAGPTKWRGSWFGANGWRWDFNLTDWSLGLANKFTTSTGFQTNHSTKTIGETHGHEPPTSPALPTAVDPSLSGGLAHSTMVWYRHMLFWKSWINYGWILPCTSLCFFKWEIETRVLQYGWTLREPLNDLRFIWPWHGVS